LLTTYHIPFLGDDTAVGQFVSVSKQLAVSTSKQMSPSLHGDITQEQTHHTSQSHVLFMKG